VKTIKDAVFGEMTYDDDWQKTEVFKVFDDDLELNVIASASEDELIEPKQRANYRYFKENIDALFDLALDALEDYCDENAEEIIEALQQGESGNSIEIPDNPLELITLTEVFFDRYGNFAIMGEAAWDDDNGIAVMFNEDGTVDVGFQDIIL
jgi:hypothetical protein